MSMNMMPIEGEHDVKTYHCRNCGASLSIPSNAKGKVTCKSCGTECVIAELIKNAEILGKENISSGISLKLPSETLHNKLVSGMTNEAWVPLDVLEKAKIINEEHIMVPAYFFRCNAIAPFSYQVGEEYKRYEGGQEKRYTEWYDKQGVASASATLVAPGNKEYSKVFFGLYDELDIKELEDIEDIVYPTDTEILTYDFPQSSSFDEYIKPQIEKLVEKNARDSMHGSEGIKWRAINITGCTISKDEVIRVLIGIYHFVCDYKGKQYSVYVSGNGKWFYYEVDKYPKDQDRYDTFRGLENNYYKIKRWYYLFLIPAVIFVFVALLAQTGAFLVGTAASVVLYIVFYFDYKKKRKNAKSAISDYQNEVISARNEFLNKEKRVQGFKQTR